ncbi:MAG: MFS transporter [Candidatus Bathycorpusculaceae bacterium]
MERKRYLMLLGAAHSFNHSLFVVAPPLLALIMSSLNVTKTEIGFVTMLASLIYGVGALVGGPLGDKIGESKTIIISLAFSGLAAFIMVAAGLTGSIYVYALALVSMAAWASLYHPTANSLIFKTFKGRVSESMGLHGVGGTVGVVMTPTVAWFIGAAFGWPWAFVAFGALCLFLAFVFIKDSGGAQRLHLGGGGGGRTLDVFKASQLWWPLILNVIIGLFMKGVELFLPTYLSENKMIDPMWSSIAFTLVLAVGVPAQWIGGKAADRFGAKKVVVATMAGVFFSLLSLLFMPIGMVGLAIFILLYGTGFYAHQPALNSLTGFLSPFNQQGAVYGVFFFTSFGLGSLSQSITGYLGDLYGLDVAFYVLAIFALASLLVSFKLPEKRET